MATTNNGWTIPAATDYVKDGYAAIDTLGNEIDTSVGKGLLAWQSYAPTLSGGWSAGNGTFSAKYVQIGKTVIAQIIFTVGSTTTKGTNFVCTLPVTAASDNDQPFQAFLDGSSNYYGSAILASTTTIQVVVLNVAGTYPTGALVSSTVPVTWTTNDVITFQAIYEAA